MGNTTSPSIFHDPPKEIPFKPASEALKDKKGAQHALEKKENKL